MTYELLNDCSHYHAGSALAAAQIRGYMARNGFTELKGAPLAVVNGEGTFHHDSPSALRLIERIRGEGGRRKVAFINSVWQSMCYAVPDLSLAVLREPLSLREFTKLHPGVPASHAADISLTYENAPKSSRGDRLLVLDSVAPETSRALRQVALRLGAEFIEMCAFGGDYNALLAKVSESRAVITGRYHGAMFAAITGTPLLCAPSNTWKTRGFLADIGRPDCFAKDEASLLLAAQRNTFACVSPEYLASVRAKWDKIFTTIAAFAEEPAFPVRRDASCVLVGNGPSVIKKKLGLAIDAHDEVIRFNAFKTRGFEAHTGRKTTVWSTFGKGSFPEDAGAFNKIIYIHGASGSPDVQGKEVFRIPAAFYQRLRQDIRAISNHRNAANLIPTSGFLVTMWLLHNRVQRVHLAGFDHFSKLTDQTHHYWDSKASGRPEEHDGDAERLLLTPWVLAGRVSYLT